MPAPHFPAHPWRAAAPPAPGRTPPAPQPPIEPQPLLPRRAGRVAYAALAAALLLAPWVLTTYQLGELSFLLIMAMASLGLMVLTGWTGQVSLGHAAFVGLGANAHALLLGAGLPWLLALALAAGTGALAGVLAGLPALRVSGLHGVIVTLACGTLVEHGLGRWSELTGGHNGLPVPPATLWGLSLDRPVAFYATCALLLAAVLLAVVNLGRSARGRSWQALRDSPPAAEALGVAGARGKLQAFVVSAGIAALAGALLAQQMQYLTPETFGVALSLQLLLMVKVGGADSPRGAVLGALVVGLLPAWISALKPALPAGWAARPGLEPFVYGLLLVACVLFEPRGLDGRWLALRRRLSARSVAR